MFMLLLWLFPWSWYTQPWRSEIPCMSKRVAHATLIFLSLTMLCDAKDKTELIFMAGNSRHSSSNKWDALHKASWRSLKIIVVKRRFFEKSQLVRKSNGVDYAADGSTLDGFRDVVVKTQPDLDKTLAHIFVHLRKWHSLKSRKQNFTFCWKGCPITTAVYGHRAALHKAVVFSQ